MEQFMWDFMLVWMAMPLVFCACAASTNQEATDTPPAPLPEENNGIAAKYPGDFGIEKDPAVVFADNFEDYSKAADLRQRWDMVHQDFCIRIAEEAANVESGRKSLEFTLPQQTTELSNAVMKQLKDERDTLFLRYYSKFEKEFDLTGSSHNGGLISAHYFPGGRATPGIPADGRNKFLATFENWRGDAQMPSPGHLNIYCYHPEQRSGYGDHFFPSGKVLPFSEQPGPFGPQFVARPDIIPERGRWYCFEFMVKANTVGQRDGRIACWVDGKLIADFPNLRFRDVETLKIDVFGVLLHSGNNRVRPNKKWYDDVVAATSYIGPMAPASRPAP